ncbi:hypothetical protein ASZ78_009655 [Callipepla squamata]|uniref:3-hydroxyisobutyryl-coenzyme A hydrolase n=1 Tax=Callipepla squamata TaxID=9009 RepID=A0A226MBG0_CALSU|nr:hypothetical protein ASZ78_009655 [Callipepla squamata]
MASGAALSFETLRVTSARDHVLHVELNRPEKRNAMNVAFWREMVECFQAISQDSACRAVVISGAGPIFTAGIDLMDMGNSFLTVGGEDAARKAWNLRQKIRAYQESFSMLEKAAWNMSMLQTEDVLKSVQAAMEKKGPEAVAYSKL